MLFPFRRWGKLRPREGERLARSAGKFVPEPTLDLNKAFSLPRAEVGGWKSAQRRFSGFHGEKDTVSTLSSRPGRRSQLSHTVYDSPGTLPKLFEN